MGNREWNEEQGVGERALRDEPDAERRRVVAFVRREASRIRHRDEGADATVAAHFEIIGDQIERGEHLRRAPERSEGDG